MRGTRSQSARSQATEIPADRHARILELIKTTGTARVEQLAEHLGVSVATVRRDLKHLQNQGFLNRVFGGAVGTAETSYAPRAQAHVAEKARIAKAAAELVGPGETIAMETGTTVVAVASALRSQGLAIVTNSIDVLLAAQGRAELSVVLTGGTFDPNTRCLCGVLPERFYAEHNVDKLIIGAGSLGVDGLRDSNIDNIGAKRAAIAAAKEVIVVADSSKFRLNALARVCEWSRVSVLITDAELPADVQEAVTAAGVRVVLA